MKAKSMTTYQNTDNALIERIVHLSGMKLNEEVIPAAVIDEIGELAKQALALGTDNYSLLRRLLNRAAAISRSDTPEKDNQLSNILNQARAIATGDPAADAQADDAVRPPTPAPAPAATPASQPGLSAPMGDDFKLTGNLRRGSRGEQVRQLQTALGMTGNEVDGVFGPRTEQAVRAFQQNQGLQVDGIVGTQTYNAILKTREDPRAQRNAPVGRISAAPTISQRPQPRESASKQNTGNALIERIVHLSGMKLNERVQKARVIDELNNLVDQARGTNNYSLLVRLFNNANKIKVDTDEGVAQLSNILNQARAIATGDPAADAQADDAVRPPTPAPAPAATPASQPGLSAPMGDDFKLTGNLRRGSRGEQVRQLQTALGMTGNEVDGVFGPRTEQAVRAFQQNQGLQVDGIVGTQTYNAILKTREDPRPQPRESASKQNTGNALNEASIAINGAAEEIAELMRMMQLAGALGAKPVDATMINQPDDHMSGCGCSGCASKKMGPEEPSMGDMLRMMSSEELAYEQIDDGDFGDATTEPDETYINDVSAIIPSGDDLHKEKGSYPATAGGDNPMKIKETLWKALNEKKAKKDYDGDGKVESPKNEYKGSKDKAIKKAIKNKKKSTTESSWKQDQEIKILRATKYSDGKVSVKYSFKTGFGEEKSDVVVGSQKYVEKKLKDEGFRGSIDYKKITPETIENKKKDVTDLETNNLTVGTSIDDFHSREEYGYSFFNNEIVKSIAKSTSIQPEVSLFMGLPEDYKKNASFIDREYAHGNLLALVRKISKSHWDSKSGKNYYVAFSNHGSFYKVIFAGTDRSKANNIWKTAIKNIKLGNDVG